MKLIRSLLAITAIVLLCPSVALADGDVDAGSNDFFVSVSAESPGSVDSPESTSQTDPVVSTTRAPICAIGGQVTCAELATCDNGETLVQTTAITVSGTVVDYGTNCPEDAVPAAAQPQVTPGLVLAAFRRIPLPPSKLIIQPPGGRTLVNFDTNFYTDNGQFTRTITLLGRRVELRIWPSAYTWRFGDGETTTTTTPGSPYPDLDITHRYLQRGHVAPSVTTTYAADFRIGNGPWREVGGTVTIPGDPATLRIVEARPVLVG